MTSRLEQLQKFLEEEPADAFTHYAIALEYISLGRQADAVEKLEEVIGLDVEYVPAYHQLFSAGAPVRGKSRTIGISSP